MGKPACWWLAHMDLNDLSLVYLVYQFGEPHVGLPISEMGMVATAEAPREWIQVAMLEVVSLQE